MPSLLSKVLLAFALDFEKDTAVSLAISANVLRLLGDEEIRIRDLPRMSGISKEAIATATGFLKRHGFADEEPESPGSRTRLFRLTAKGHAAKSDYEYRLAAIEQQWSRQFGASVIDRLREHLEGLVGDATAEKSSLFRGLEPYAEGWRASVPRPNGLPHYPVVLHRGGYPDGS